MAILDIHDLGLAREQGHDIVGVMAFVQRPLAAVLAAARRSARPRDLEGERAGVTGLPSDDAVLRRSSPATAGTPSRCADVTIGFQAVKALLAGRVDGATAFWNAEGVALRRERPGIQRVPRRRLRRAAVPGARAVRDARRRSRTTRRRCAATIRALQRGYGEAQRDPESAVAAMLAAEPRLDRRR